MKTITQAQYYQLVGLLAAHTEQQKILKSLERAATAITDERDKDGVPENSGHTLDWLWGSRETDEMLRLLEIEVLPPGSADNG